MATTIARPPASRRLRSRIKWPTREGPTPRPADAAESGVSIESSLLGFDDLRTQSREEVAVGGVGRQPGLEILQRVRNFIGFEQQIVEFLGGGRTGNWAEIPLGAGDIAVGQP